MPAPDFVSHPGEPYGAWCYRKDPKCGEPTADGAAGFCGEACWRAAGKPGEKERTHAETVKRLAADPKIRDAIRRLAPKPGSGITSVTFSSPGMEPVTLTQDDRRRLDAARRAKR